jgi:hypothetical protein
VTLFDEPEDDLRFIVVHEVAESWRVYHSQSEPDSILLDVCGREGKYKLSTPQSNAIINDSPALLDSMATVLPVAFPFMLESLASERGAPRS